MERTALNWDARWCEGEPNGNSAYRQAQALKGSWWDDTGRWQSNGFIYELPAYPAKVVFDVQFRNSVDMLITL